MHSSFLEETEEESTSDEKLISICNRIINFCDYFSSLFFLGLALFFSEKLARLSIDYRNPFFISSLLFSLFSFLNIMYITLYLLNCRFINSDKYSILYMQYHYEIEKLQTDKISKDIADTVIHNLYEDKKIFLYKYCEPFLLVKNLSYEKWNNKLDIGKNKNISNLFFSFGTTTIGIVITLLLANNLSKESLRFGALLLLVLTLVFFAFAIIPNPIFKKIKCKKLAEKTELIKRLNEEIEIQERKILNKE